MIHMGIPIRVVLIVLIDFLCYNPNLSIIFFLSKISKSLYSCPVPKNKIGFPVTCATESAVPPFSSTSAFESIIPVKSIESSKAFAWRVASFPVIDSPRNIFMLGFVMRDIFSISFIKESRFCIRPAVSIRTTSILFLFAYFIASNPTEAGSEP